MASSSTVKHKQARISPSALKQAEGNLGIQRMAIKRIVMKHNSRSLSALYQFEGFLCAESSTPALL